MANATIPTVLAMLLCDTVITDAESGKKSLIGLFDTIYARQLPFLYAGGFAIYARLSDAEGKYVFRAEIQYLEEDKAIGSATTNEIEAKDRLAFVDLVMRLPALPIEKYGKYEFQLFANNIYIGRCTLSAQASSPKRN